MSIFYQPGDVLVQAGGEPWPTIARIATGEPYCHAQIVSQVSPEGQVWIIEEHATGLWEKRAWNIDWFEVWRPDCSDEIKLQVVQNLRDRQGIIYAYHKIIQVGLGHRLGLWQEPEDFDNQRYDCEPMLCSEAIARYYWRAGYDLVPGVSNRNTLPKDLRNPQRLTFVGRP